MRGGHSSGAQRPLRLHAQRGAQCRAQRSAGQFQLRTRRVQSRAGGQQVGVLGQGGLDVAIQRGVAEGLPPLGVDRCLAGCGVGAVRRRPVLRDGEAG